VEHLNRQLLSTLGTIALGQHPPGGPIRRPLADRHRQARATERMDGRSTFKPVKKRQRARFLTATTFLLGGVFHGTPSKSRLSAHAIAGG
jgi:hypothetical protein